MVRKNRRGGDRSTILVNEGDLMILRTINKTDRDLSIGEIQDKLKMSHVSFKVHFRRLIKLKFLTKSRVEGMNKYILKITPLGKKLLELF